MIPNRALLIIALTLFPMAVLPQDTGAPAAPEGLQSVALDREPPGRLPDFRLLDTRDRPFRRQSLVGKWSLLYFGYTQCPDICPTALSALASAFREAGKQANLDRLQVVFVTVDPERDRPEVMKQYVRYFHPAFLGLRADLTETRKLSSAVEIFHYIAKSRDGSRYTVSHSGEIAVIDPRGLHVGRIEPPFDSASIAADLIKLSLNP